MIWARRWSERGWDAAAAIIAAASLGYSAYAGGEQRQSAKKGMRLQEKAQQEAHASAVSEARTAEENERKARMRTPDLDVLLADAMKPPSGGSGSIDQNRLMLGKPSALGY